MRYNHIRQKMGSVLFGGATANFPRDLPLTQT